MAVDAESIDLYAASEKAAREILLEWRRKRAALHRVPGIRLEPRAPRSVDPVAKTVPSDTRCWAIDVERLLEQLDTPTSAAFVHPCASAILLAKLVEGIRAEEVRERTGVSSRHADFILEGAVTSFVAHYVPIAVAYEDPAA